MIDVKQAASALKQKYPNRRITNAMDYDSAWWLFEAPEGDNVDYDCPLFAVNKRTGAVRTYSMNDMDAFTDAYLNRRIQI